MFKKEYNVDGVIGFFVIFSAVLIYRHVKITMKAGRLQSELDHERATTEVFSNIIKEGMSPAPKK